MIISLITQLDKGHSHHPRKFQENAFLSIQTLTYDRKASTSTMGFLLVYGWKMELKLLFAA